VRERKISETGEEKEKQGREKGRKRETEGERERGAEMYLGYIKSILIMN